MVLHKGELEAKLKDENQMIKSGILRDENPLDESEAFNKLLLACRLGDLKTCQQLISAGVNINGKDAFDYTPLIIASLCGHYELVMLLLESGALAERNTFQGERCIYNALNNKIRDLLLQYDFSKSSDPLQAWSAHMTSLLTREVPKTTDITLTEGSESFSLHKFLLSSRTPYFKQKLASAPETETWKLPTSIPVEAFRLVLRYLYLWEMPRDVADPNGKSTEYDILRGVDKLSNHLNIGHLWEAIMSMHDRRLARQRHQDEVDRAQRQVEAFFRTAVLGNKMIVDEPNLEKIKWPRSNSIFADCLLAAHEPGALDYELQGETRHHPTLDRSNSIPIGPSSNSEAEVRAKELTTGRVALYPAHKAMLIRSPYFETMFSGEFKEAQDSEHLHIITMDFAPEVLEIILIFLYTEKVECPLELGIDLLYASDMLFLDRLKAKAATVISTLGSATSNALVDRTRAADSSGSGPEQPEMEPINIYDVIHAAWELRIQRLEEFAARYLAYRLEDYIDDDDFQDLIRQSAARVENRQETDTIELLDDIRYYLSERFRLRFEDAGLEEMMDEEDEIDAALAAGLANKASLGTSQHGAEQNSGMVTTLDGNVVEDEFDSDAINYQILLEKIDTMLGRLKLDA